MSAGQMGGKIIGAKHRHHAMGLVPHRLARAQIGLQPALAGPLRIGGDADIHLAHQRGYFRPCVPQRLAGFARDQVGQRILFAAHDIDEAAQRFDAIGDRLRGPFGPGGARGGHLDLDVARLPLPEQVAGGGFMGCKRRDHLSRAMPEIG